MKKNEIMPLSAAWMDLNMIILSEDRETQILYDITYMCNKKMVHINLITKQKKTHRLGE